MSTYNPSKLERDAINGICNALDNAKRVFLLRTQTGAFDIIDENGARTDKRVERTFVSASRDDFGVKNQAERSRNHVLWALSSADYNLTTALRAAGMIDTVILTPEEKAQRERVSAARTLANAATENPAALAQAFASLTPEALAAVQAQIAALATNKAK